MVMGLGTEAAAAAAACRVTILLVCPDETMNPGRSCGIEGF